MSLVERLAKRYRNEFAMLISDDDEIVIPATEDDTRWWLNAIADELEEVGSWAPDGSLRHAARYLRAEAAPDREMEE